MRVWVGAQYIGTHITHIWLKLSSSSISTYFSSHSWFRPSRQISTYDWNDNSIPFVITNQPFTCTSNLHCYLLGSNVMEPSDALTRHQVFLNNIFNLSLPFCPGLGEIQYNMKRVCGYHPITFSQMICILSQANDKQMNNFTALRSYSGVFQIYKYGVSTLEYITYIQYTIICICIYFRALNWNIAHHIVQWSSG